MGCTKSTVNIKESQHPKIKQEKEKQTEETLKENIQEKNIEKNKPFLINKKKEYYIPRSQCFTDQELSLIQEIAQDPSLKDNENYILYDKQIIRISKDKTINKEIFCIKLNENEQKDKDFDYKSSSITTKNIKELSIEIDDNISASCPIELKDLKLILLVFL